MAPAEISETSTDYSFYFKCLAGIATVAGVSLLLAGILATLPIIAGIGIALATTGIIVGAGLAIHGLFSKAPSVNTDTALFPNLSP
jgi:hypothetical protein